MTRCGAIGKPAQGESPPAMKSRDALPRASGNRCVTRVPLASEHVRLDNRALNARLEEQSVRIAVCKEQGMKRPPALSQHKLILLNWKVALNRECIMSMPEMKSATIAALLFRGIIV